MSCWPPQMATALPCSSSARATRGTGGLPAIEKATGDHSKPDSDLQYLDLQPVTRMAGSVRLPGSKSISNRVLLLAALARGHTRIEGLLDADDVDRMLDA